MLFRSTQTSYAKLVDGRFELTTMGPDGKSTTFEPTGVIGVDPTCGTAVAGRVVDQVTMTRLAPSLRTRSSLSPLATPQQHVAYRVDRDRPGDRLAQFWRMLFDRPLAMGSAAGKSLSNGKGLSSVLKLR